MAESFACTASTMEPVALRSPLGDLYEELGVARDATREAISAAYRARAKELHPDTRPLDADAGDRFAASAPPTACSPIPRSRARYDAAQASAAPGPAPPPAPIAPRTAPTVVASVAPPKRPRLTRKGARWCAWGGAGLMVLGIVVAAFVLSLQRHDADLRSHGVATTAVVVPVDGERRLEFETRAGTVVRAVESVKTGEEQPALGTRVRIHYDPADPTTIVTDISHTGRDVTLWIVAVKLVLGGAVLVGFGVRHLRRTAG